MNRRILIPTLIFAGAFTVLLLAALPVLAAHAADGASPNVEAIRACPNCPNAGREGGPLVAGNYCVSCHLADDPRLATAASWAGSIHRQEISPCPAATAIHKELYYTERLLLMIERAEGSVGALPDKTQARLDDTTQRYSRMLDAPITSLDAFASEAQTTRFQLNKVYAVLNDMAETARLRTVLIYAAIITLIVLGSLGWGLYNTRRIHAGSMSRSWGTFWRGAFALAVLASFALPIFRVPAAEVAMATEEQQQVQTTLDTAQRAADAADRAQARAWIMARVGTAWNELDSEQAQTVLDESLAALAEARANEEALWGQSLSVEEATVGAQIEMESANLIAADLNAARSRSWALPLIALEWNHYDPTQAAALLQAEQNRLALASANFPEEHADVYQDLQMRGLALAWAKVDAARAPLAAAEIHDPSIRAWTLRELAVLNSDPVLFERAAEAAFEVYDPVQRSRSFREIGSALAATGDPSDLFTESLTALDGVSGDPLAYALSALAAASGDITLVEQIDPAYADARASALLRLGEFQHAWDAAAQILDPYEKARAQAAIAGAWVNADAAAQIAVPLYRDAALRDIARTSGKAAWVETISSAYYQVQALTALGDLGSAAQLAGDLGEPYPLVELAAALSASDPQAALALFDGLSRETDKAAALLAVAAASPDPAVIEQAQGMALAGRVRGDSLAPTQALLDLALALWSPTNMNAQADMVVPILAQAYEAAQRIAIK